MNVMVDLETLDVAPTAMILSIGAVRFDENGVYETKYIVVDAHSCLDYNRTVSLSTLAWWLDKEPEAQSVLQESLSGKGTPLQEALQDLLFFFQNTSVRIWGNGADFDNVILADSLKACDLFDNSSYLNNRCYRTLRNLFPNIPRERHGVHHNALDDAITQARHASAILKHISSFPPEKGSGNAGDNGT